MNLFSLGNWPATHASRTLAMATVAYYGMQMLFLPMVERR